MWFIHAEIIDTPIAPNHDRGHSMGKLRRDQDEQVRPELPAQLSWPRLQLVAPQGFNTMKPWG
jgi:hypothetical protein